MATSFWRLMTHLNSIKGIDIESWKSEKTAQYADGTNTRKVLG